MSSVTLNGAPPRLTRARALRRIKPLFTVYLPVLPYIFFALFPLYFMAVTSLKGNAELYDVTTVPFWIFRGVTIGHYQILSEETMFWSWFANSLIVSISATVISVVLGILAAYPLARLRFPGAESFGVAVFITYLVPPSLLFLPLSSVVNWLGLSDSLWALIVTYPTFLVPFCTWLLMGYFRTVPKEIEECAMLDGCNRLQTMVRILLPAAVPGVICAALFAFTLSWNEFLYALVFVSPAELKTMTVGVFSELIRGDVYYWGALMAGACIGSLPIVVAYVLFLDYYVSGLTSGAIK
jgi:multiple sugar transport system permease protein